MSASSSSSPSHTGTLCSSETRTCTCTNTLAGIWLITALVKLHGLPGRERNVCSLSLVFVCQGDSQIRRCFELHSLQSQGTLCASENEKTQPLSCHSLEVSVFCRRWLGRSTVSSDNCSLVESCLCSRFCGNEKIPTR